MASTHLTARFCAAARPKAGTAGKPVQTAFGDDDPIGLELRVSAEGRKVWSYRYRTLDGRQRRLTLGVFAPGDEDEGADDEARPLTLRAARRRARQMRAVVESGGDPAAQKRRAKEIARARTIRTFNDLADAYLAACESGEWRPKGRRKRERTIGDERKILDRYVRKELGALALEDIDRARVKSLLRAMTRRGIGAQTNRTQAVIRQAFAWAIAEDRVATNPATGFKPLAEEKPRARIATDDELRAVWAILAGQLDRVMVPVEGSEPRPLYLSRQVAIILQLCALLLQRRAEVAGMRRDELNLAEATWTLPGERTKNGKPHLVPLPPLAVELIKEALALAAFGREKPPAAVFPGKRNGETSLRPDSVTHALADVTRAAGCPGLTVHDLRRTGASVMASERLGVAPHVISRLLNHTDTGGAAAVTTRHYAVHDYAPEKRRALEAWEGLLLEIVGARTSKPTPLKGVAA